MKFTRSIIVTGLVFCSLKAITDGACVAAFPGEDDARNIPEGAAVPQRIIRGAVVQWVFPSISFSCNGSLTRWIFQARSNSDSSIGLPRLQLWRYQTAAAILELVSTSGSEEEFSGGEGPVYKYTLQSQLEVRAGYVLGIYLPEHGAEKLWVKFLDKGEGGAPSSASRGDYGDTFSIVSGYMDQRYIPLVAAEISLPGDMTTTVILNPTPLSPSGSAKETTPSSTTTAAVPGPSMQASNTSTYTTTQPSEQPSELQGLSSTNTPTQPDLPTPENLSATLTAIAVGTTVGGVSIILIVTLAVVLLTRHAQAKVKQPSNSDNNDYIQTFPNAAYSSSPTIHTASNTAYITDDYSYPLPFQEEARYIERIGGSDTGEYDYCRPT